MTTAGTRDPDRINLDWLIRLRWAAIGGQLITIAAVQFAMQLAIPIVPLLVLVGLEVASNLACEVPPVRRTSASAPQDGSTELREELRRLIIEELTTIIRS